MPRLGEDMSKSEAIAPAVETLLELRGTLDHPIHDIRFEGIAFRHGNWLRPSKIGHCEVQANFIVDSTPKRQFTRPEGRDNIHNENLKSPANVVCHAAKSIRFERCAFSQLGGPAWISSTAHRTTSSRGAVSMALQARLCRWETY